MNFKPMGSRVLLKRVAEEKKTQGGLYVPDSAQEKSVIAEVVEVGPGADYWDNVNCKMVTIPVAFKVGDHVVIPKFGQADLKLNGVEYILLNAHEILGKMDGSN